jgi:hypothetical protein
MLLLPHAYWANSEWVILSIESKVQDDDSPHQISELYLVIFCSKNWEKFKIQFCISWFIIQKIGTLAADQKKHTFLILLLLKMSYSTRKERWLIYSKNRTYLDGFQMDLCFLDNVCFFFASIQFLLLQVNDNMWEVQWPDHNYKFSCSGFCSMQLSALLVMHHNSSKVRVLQVSTNVKVKISPLKSAKRI